MKRIILTAIIFISLFTISQAQHHSEVYVEDYKVSLDFNNPINSNHPYADHLSKQDDLYIAWYYGISKKNMHNTPEYKFPAVIIDDQEGNNSLIFTLNKKGVITYDTLRNTIHDLSDGTGSCWDRLKRIKDDFLTNFRPGSSKSNDLLRRQKLEGSLPRGAMMWHEDKRWGLDFGVKVPHPSAYVTIVIKDTRDEVITTIIDKTLRKGWNNFKWKRGHHPRGTYNITVTMDGQTMSQNFES